MLQDDIQTLSTHLDHLEKKIKRSRATNYVLYTLSIILFIYYSMLLPKSSRELSSKETGPKHIVALIDSQVPSNHEIIKQIESELPNQSIKALDLLEQKLPELEEALSHYLAKALAPKLKIWTKDHPQFTLDFIKKNPITKNALSEAEARKLSRKFYTALEENRKIKFDELQSKFDEVFSEVNTALKSPKSDKQKALRKLIIASKYFQEKFTN